MKKRERFEKKKKKKNDSGKKKNELNKRKEKKSNVRKNRRNVRWVGNRIIRRRRKYGRKKYWKDRKYNYGKREGYDFNVDNKKSKKCGKDRRRDYGSRDRNVLRWYFNERNERR